MSLTAGTPVNNNNLNNNNPILNLEQNSGVSTQQQRTIGDKAKEFVMDLGTLAFKEVFSNARKENSYAFATVFTVTVALCPPLIPLCSAISMYQKSQAKEELKATVNQANHYGIEMANSSDKYGGMKHSTASNAKESTAALKSNIETNKLKVTQDRLSEFYQKLNPEQQKFYGPNLQKAFTSQNPNQMLAGMAYVEKRENLWDFYKGLSDEQKNSPDGKAFFQNLRGDHLDACTPILKKLKD